MGGRKKEQEKRVGYRTANGDTGLQGANMPQNQPQPQQHSMPQFQQQLNGMSQAQMRPPNAPPQQMMDPSQMMAPPTPQQMLTPMPDQQQGQPGQQPAQFQHQMEAMQNGTPGPQYQPKPSNALGLDPMVARLYGLE